MQKSWLSDFSQSPSIAKLKEVISSGQGGRPIWWAIPGDVSVEQGYLLACRGCEFARRSPEKRRLCKEVFLLALKRAGESRQPVQFLCPTQEYALCLPLVQNGNVRGYLGVCHLPQAVSPESLKLAGLTAQTAAREAERAQELKNLSEAIQPRCVALSTIHTIHRLISSTLNLEELLPRVARLCCQVLRAQSCAIWLVDRHGRKLIPRAFIETDSRARSARSLFQKKVRPQRLGFGLLGKVASACQARLTPHTMAVPLVEEDCIGVIQVKRTASHPTFNTLDQEILTTLAEQAVVAIRNAQMYETQERVTWGTIKSLSAILEGMESYPTGGPSRRKILPEVALAIAEEMGLPSSLKKPLQYAAILHDAGRVGIPEEILRKTTKLEPAEFAKVKEHPVKGARFLEPLEILEPAIPFILHHHERYDGTGYPKGLKKEAIPLGARILAVANAFEAMVSDRPYRRAVPIAKAAQEIASHGGTQFDPKVVQAFLNLVRSKKLERLLPREEPKVA